MIDYGFNQPEICWGTTSISAADVLRVIQGVKAVGGSRLRMAVQLGAVADLDNAITLCVQNGIKPLPCLINNPAFGYDGTVAGFANMCTTIATRYGPLGTNQVTEYELFNEPNNSTNPPGGADAASFTAYLKAGYTAIKAVHSSSTVICGGSQPGPSWGIPFIGGLVSPVDWYTGIYNAGGKNYFDALGFHWYTTAAPAPGVGNWTYLDGVLNLMTAQGDGSKKMWITEIGVALDVAPDEATATAWLQTMVNAILTTYSSRMGPFFIYDFKNDTNNPGDSNSIYGIEDYSFNPKHPLYDYVATINPPSGTMDTTPPSAPTGIVVETVDSTTATITWTASTDNVGVAGYRVYLSNGTKMADTNQTIATLTGLTPGTPYQLCYITAYDAAGNESGHSLTFSFTTNAPSGSLAYYQYTFTGSTLPPVFAQIGLGFSVSSGIALPNAPTTDRLYLTPAPYGLDQRSPDHSSTITQSSLAVEDDRLALAAVRMLSDGSQFMAATIGGGGEIDACQLLMITGGLVQEVVAAENAAPLALTDSLQLSVQGNVYTVTRISTGNVRSVVLTWTDTHGIYPGATNRRSGFGWQHKRSSGIYYPPPGITGTWTGADITAVAPQPGVSDAWTLAVVHSDKWGELLATGDWESLI